MNATEHRWTSLPRWSVSAAVWLAALAAVLAWVLSYTSQVDLASHHGYVWWQAALWPLTTDLVSLALMIVAMDAADTQRRGATARTAFLTVLGALVMIVGNAIIAWPDVVAVAMHTWPPFIGAALWFVLAHDRPRTAPAAGTVIDATAGPGGQWEVDGQARTGRLTGPPDTSNAIAPPREARPPAVRNGPSSGATEAQFRAAVESLGPGATERELAAHLGVTDRTVRRYKRQWPDASRPRVVRADG